MKIKEHIMHMPTGRCVVDKISGVGLELSESVIENPYEHRSTANIDFRGTGELHELHLKVSSTFVNYKLSSISFDEVLEEQKQRLVYHIYSDIRPYLGELEHRIMMGDRDGAMDLLGEVRGMVGCK